MPPRRLTPSPWDEFPPYMAATTLVDRVRAVKRWTDNLGVGHFDLTRKGIEGYAQLATEWGTEVAERARIDATSAIEPKNRLLAILMRDHMGAGLDDGNGTETPSYIELSNSLGEAIRHAARILSNPNAPTGPN